MPSVLMSYMPFMTAQAGLQRLDYPLSQRDGGVKAAKHRRRRLGLGADSTM